AKKVLGETDIDAGKADLVEMVSMLVGLIRSNSEARLHEDEVPSRVEAKSLEPMNYGKRIKSKIMSKIKNSAATRLIILIFLLILISPAQSADWPRWGGPDPGRNMYSPAKGLPDRFDPGKPKSGTEDIDLKTTRNVKWVAKLGSQAYGNVVVAGGKVFIGTNNEHPRDPQHQGDRSILLCFDEKTSELLWQLVVPQLAPGTVYACRGVRW